MKGNRADGIRTSLARRLDEVMVNHAHRQAIADHDEQITYGSLQTEVRSLAAELWSVGARPGCLVAVEATGDIAQIAGMYAVSAVGSAFLLLDQDWPQQRRARALDVANPVCVIRADRDASGAIGLAEVRKHRAASTSAWSGAAYGIFTSGSTGTPKGMAIPDTGLANVLREQHRLFGTTPDSKVMQWAPWSFDAAIFDVALALSGGGSLVLAGRTERLPGPGLSGFVHDWGITHLTTTPTALALTPLPPPDSGLRVVISAGEVLVPDVARRWAGGSHSLYNAYGPAEAGIWTHLAQIRPGAAQIDVGSPIGATGVRIHDTRGAAVAPGETGEIWLSGPGVAASYLGDDPLPERFPVIDGDEGAVRYFRTGDVGYVNPAGALVVTGRMDRQVKLHGVRIDLDEIDNELGTVTGVRAAATTVVGIGPEARIVSFVVGSPPITGPPETIRQALSRRLPAYHVPTEFRYVDGIPLNASGKRDFRALLRLSSADAPPAADTAAPENGPDAKIVALIQVWQEILHTTQVGADDDWFDIGGNSLKAVRLAARISKRFGIEITVETLFQARTVRAVAALIEERS